MRSDLHLYPGIVPDDVSQTGEGQLTLLGAVCGEHGDRDQVGLFTLDKVQQVHCESLGVLQGKGGVGVVDPQVDRAHHELL